MQIQKAQKENAHDLAYLINLAGEGIPEYLWQDMAEENESPLDVGTRRAARDEGGFSYRNARVCVENDELLGMIISYQLPNPYVDVNLSDYPEVVRPLVALESRVPGSWYVNAIATFEMHRGKGAAKKMMADAQVQALESGCNKMSLIMASENTAARKLYEKLGFEDVESIPVVAFPGCLHRGNWVLMVRNI
jgi:ribosomal protein S18 acetylase RimI-like enzyme